jgi:hypothetical protein
MEEDPYRGKCIRCLQRPALRGERWCRNCSEQDKRNLFKWGYPLRPREPKEVDTSNLFLEREED